MQFLFESKVASIAQLRTKFFSKVTQQAASKRLSRLVRQGWLSCFGYAEHEKMRFVYSLSHKGYETFVLREGENDRRRQLTSDSIGHDLALVDIRLALARNPAVTAFVTENLLQSCQEYSEDVELEDLVSLRVDGAVQIKAGSRRTIAPIEYEASLKSRERCRDKIEGFYANYDGSLVIFVCKDESILKRMREIDKDVCQNRPSKMYFSLLKNVIESSSKLLLQTPDGDTLYLG